MQVHKLKTWPEYFELVVSGKKMFEIRFNDRDFKVGDLLVLEEWKPTQVHECEYCTGKGTVVSLQYDGCPTIPCRKCGGSGKRWEGYYTGRKMLKVVTCVIKSFWGLAEGHAAMGLREGTKDDVLQCNKPEILANFPWAKFDETKEAA